MSLNNHSYSKYLISDMITKQFFSWTKFFKHLFCTNFIISILLLSSQNALSQIVDFGRGALLRDPGSLGTDRNLQIGTNNICPTPSFNVSAFGGSGTDWANNSNPYDSAYTGASNYGAAVGFNVPIGKTQKEFCQEFTRNRAIFEQTRTENLLRNSQLSLVQQCYWLQTSGFLNDANREIFANNENFSSLLPCFEVNLNRQGASINPVTSPEPPTLTEPPKSDTESPEPGNLRILDVNE